MGKFKMQQNDQSSVYQRCLTLMYYLFKKKKNRTGNYKKTNTHLMFISLKNATENLGLSRQHCRVKLVYVSIIQKSTAKSHQHKWRMS